MSKGSKRRPMRVSQEEWERMDTDTMTGVMLMNEYDAKYGQYPDRREICEDNVQPVEQ